MEQCNRHLIMFWISKINDYLRKSGLQIDPLPKIQITDDEENYNDIDDILISEAYLKGNLFFRKFTEELKKDIAQKAN